MNEMDEITAIVTGARATHRVCLVEAETKRILAARGIATATCREALGADHAVELAGQVGYPVVLKVSSPAILHKSDVGGVRVGLCDPAAVAAAHDDILRRAAEIDPQAVVTVQPMISAGVEVIVGVTQDPQFGPVLMFGLGGIFTELLHDVCFRMIPIGPADARQMVASVKGSALLKGYRGDPARDVDAVCDVLQRVSELVVAHPEIAELDLNPVVVHERGAVVVDARAVLGQ